MIPIAFLLATIGLAAFGLAAVKHHDWAFGRRLGLVERRIFRWVGGTALAISFWAAMAGWGAAFGSVGWFGLLTLAAAILLLVRSYARSRPRH